jgi:hypothetical protein
MLSWAVIPTIFAVEEEELEVEDEPEVALVETLDSKEETELSPTAEVAQE